MSDDEEDLAFELTPHDALFRRALEHLDDAKSAVRAALPESLATRIDWSGFAPAARVFSPRFCATLSTSGAATSGPS